jgi:ABC-type uncharacterized transport system fused permease/ATPase subunit
VRSSPRVDRLNWREWMSTELARQYYTNRTYYKIESDPTIDNPDQRITEDVTAFTSVSLGFAITLMTSVIDLISFSAILCAAGNRTRHLRTRRYAALLTSRVRPSARAATRSTPSSST